MIESKVSYTLEVPSKSAPGRFKSFKKKLLNVNCWDHFSPIISFELCDVIGRKVTRKEVKTGDFIKLDLPGPNGFDWVQIENIICEDKYVAITVRPSYCPSNNPLKKDVIEHVFTKDSTNQFILSLDQNIISLTVFGENIGPNNGQDAGNEVLAARNLFGFKVATSGIQQLQWNGFCKNFFCKSTPFKNKKATFNTSLYLLIIAGIFQIILWISTFFMGKMLHIEEDMVKIKPLTRQIFYVTNSYIGYEILIFGLLSFLRPKWLLENKSFGRFVSIFLGTFWFARLLIQLFYYAHTEYVVQEILLTLLFIYLSIVYLAIGLQLFNPRPQFESFREVFSNLIDEIKY